MTESRQVRIAKLTVDVNRRRRALGFLKRRPPEVLERLKKGMAELQQLEAELKALEDELHKLRVEQIREESSKIE